MTKLLQCLRLGAGAIVLLAPGAALAHGGAVPAAGLGAGLLHPLLGLDHLLAMIAVGLWATILGGRAFWLLPAAFVAVMALGGVLAFAGWALPAVEAVVLGSVLALGALIAVEARLPVALAVAVVAGFALFHGHAHGSEMPATASGLLYGAGFMAATAALHLAGVALGLGLAASVGAWSRRLGGATIVGLGLALLTAG